jgi:chorismate mutase/prephenate dehydratase
VHVYIPGREKKVYEKLNTVNHGPLSNDSLQAIYREIISASISLQKDVTIGYLGPQGTFSHHVGVEDVGGLRDRRL